MQLRNRITRQTYNDSISLGLVSSATLFQKPSLRQKINKIVEPVPEDLQDFVRNMIEDIDKNSISEDKKCEYAQNIAFLCRTQVDLIRKLVEQPDLLKEIQDACLSPEKKSKYKVPSFFPQLFKTLCIAALSRYAPVGTLAASIAYQVYSGIPAGGTDYCGANIYYCNQGYLTDIQKKLIATFSRTLLPGGAKNNNDLLVMQCLDVNKVGNTIGQFLNATTTNGRLTCAASSVPYYLSTVTVEATNLPVNSCDAFQQAFTPVFQSCMNSASSLGVIIGASVAGGVVGVAAIVAAACLIARSSCGSKCSPCC